MQQRNTNDCLSRNEFCFVDLSKENKNKFDGMFQSIF
jgi:hypothetical protein